MIEQLIESVLLSRGPMRPDQVAVALMVTESQVEAGLRALRKLGLASKKSDNRTWRWDGDFCCSKCRRAMPAVRRCGVSNVCSRCFRERYQLGDAKIRIPEAWWGSSRTSRFTADEVGMTWAAALSQAWLFRRIV